MNRGLVLNLFLASAVGAQATDPYEVKTRMLTHARYSEREKAARELEEAGEPALKALRTACNSNDPELRRRAETIVSRIERAQLSRKLLVAPQLHLKFDKVPLQQAISEVATKSGIRIYFDPKDTNPQRAITLDTGNVPFWQAIQAFFDAGGLVENDAPPSGSAPPPEGRRSQRGMSTAWPISGQPEIFIRLTAGKGTLPVVLSHGLRVRVVSPAYALNKYDEATGEVKFHLDVDAAKGIEVREIVGIEVRRASAKDHRQLACAFPTPALQPNYYGEQMLMMQQVVIVNGELLMDDGRPAEPFVPVTLKTGGIRPDALAEFHGVVVARIVAPPEAIVTLQDVFQSKGQSQTRDGLSMTLKSYEEATSNLATLRVQVSSTGESINELLNIPVQVKGRARPFIRINRGGTIVPGSATELQVRDADGKPAKIVATRIIASTSNGVTFTQDLEIKIERPMAGLKNMNLSLNGRRLAVVEMPFVLRDVPLR